MSFIIAIDIVSVCRFFLSYKHWTKLIRIEGTYSIAVEIFKSATWQLYKTDPIPTACRNLSLVIIAIGNTCYALGRHKVGDLNHALYPSVNDLLGNAVPANQSTCDTTQHSLPSISCSHASSQTSYYILYRKDMSEGGRTFTCTLPPLPPGSTSAIYIPTPRFSTVVLSSMHGDPTDWRLG